MQEAYVPPEPWMNSDCNVTKRHNSRLVVRKQVSLSRQSASLAGPVTGIHRHANQHQGSSPATMFAGHCNASTHESNKLPSPAFKEAQEMTESFSAGGLIARVRMSKRKV